MLAAANQLELDGNYSIMMPCNHFHICRHNCSYFFNQPDQKWSKDLILTCVQFMQPTLIALRVIPTLIAMKSLHWWIRKKKIFHSFFPYLVIKHITIYSYKSLNSLFMVCYSHEYFFHLYWKRFCIVELCGKTTVSRYLRGGSLSGTAS